MKHLHALLARDRENLQENPRALLLLTCKLADHTLQTIILNTLPQSPRTGTGKSTKIIEKRFVTNTQYPENTPSSFKMQLPSQVHLSEDWEVDMTHVILGKMYTENKFPTFHDATLA